KGKVRPLHTRPNCFLGWRGTQVKRRPEALPCRKCSLLPNCPTQNRYALLLEMLCLSHYPTQKPLRSFAGNARSLRPRSLEEFSLCVEGPLIGRPALAAGDVGCEIGIGVQDLGAFQP